MHYQISERGDNILTRDKLLMIGDTYEEQLLTIVNSIKTIVNLRRVGCQCTRLFLFSPVMLILSALKLSRLKMQ